MRRSALIFAGLLAALPAQGQAILGVLGGTAVNADDPGAVVTIDPNTGAATVLGTPIPGESLTGVARLNDGRVVASTATFTGPSRLIEINPTTGALVQVIGAFADGQLPLTIHDLAVDEFTGILTGFRPAPPKGRRAKAASGTRARRRRASAAPARRPTSTRFRDPPGHGGRRLHGHPARDRRRFHGAGRQRAATCTACRPTRPPFTKCSPARACPGPPRSSPAPAGTARSGFRRASTTAPRSASTSRAAAKTASATRSTGSGNLTFEATLLGSAGGTRRVRDLVVLPAVGPGASLVEVPVHGKQGIAALVLLLALAGGFLLKRR